MFQPIHKQIIHGFVATRKISCVHEKMINPIWRTGFCHLSICHIFEQSSQMFGSKVVTVLSSLSSIFIHATSEHASRLRRGVREHSKKTIQGDNMLSQSLCPSHKSQNDRSLSSLIDAEWARAGRRTNNMFVPTLINIKIKVHYSIDFVIERQLFSQWTVY